MALAHEFLGSTDEVPILDGLGILAEDVEDFLGPSGGYYGVIVDPDSESASMDMDELEEPVADTDKTDAD